VRTHCWLPGRSARRTLLRMLLHPAVEADYAAIVDLANLAFRGSGSLASWNTEAVFIEGQRLDESLLREDLAAKPEAQLLTYRDDPDGPLLGTVWLDERKDGVWNLGLLTVRPDLQKETTRARSVRCRGRLRERTWRPACSYDGGECPGHPDCVVSAARI